MPAEVKKAPVVSVITKTSGIGMLVCVCVCVCVCVHVHACACGDLYPIWASTCVMIITQFTTDWPILAYMLGVWPLFGGPL